MPLWTLSFFADPCFRVLMLCYESRCAVSNLSTAAGLEQRRFLYQQVIALCFLRALADMQTSRM